MKKSFFAALILVLASLPAHANTERKRNAEKPDYDTAARALAFEMALIPESGVEIGQPVNVMLKMVDTKSGLAVPASFLRETGDHIMHLTLTDGTLTDVQHLHPSPTETDGIYRFSFTPRMPGGYRGWAHVVSVEGKQQFVMGDIGTVRGGGLTKEVILQTQAGGYDFKLEFDDTPKLNNSRDAKLVIARNGAAVVPEQIYIIGIHEDLRTILKTKFEEGSKLDFEIKPEEPGFVKLFIYATIGNQPPVEVSLGFHVTGKKESDFKFKSIF
ncbi:MAG: hypothetical protein AB7L92_08475 [Alphaproteobacteria bacterium]